MHKINFEKFGFADQEQAKQLCLEHNVDVEKIVKNVQPIAFDNAVMAYELGVAIALKNRAENSKKAAEYIGQGLQAYCVPGSVADERQIGLGHGRIASMLLDEKTKCFCF